MQLALALEVLPNVVVAVVEVGRQRPQQVRAASAVKEQPGALPREVRQRPPVSILSVVLVELAGRKPHKLAVLVLHLEAEAEAEVTWPVVAAAELLVQ